MIWHVVSTLQRGAVNPPERCEPGVEAELNAAQDISARLERDRPMCIEEMWRLQGYSAGYITRHAKRRNAA